MKEIILANKRDIALVDDEDYEMLSQYKWYKNNTGYVHTHFYIDNVRLLKSMHWILLQPPKKLEIDHIDNNPLNNQKKNLRICTRSQNLANKPKYKIGTSKYKGVSWDKHNNKWVSCIKYNQKNIHLGRFKNEIDAAKAYNERAKELFKEFAYLNEV